jgi:hypothetical protein
MRFELNTFSGDFLYFREFSVCFTAIASKNKLSKSNSKNMLPIPTSGTKVPRSLGRVGFI